MQRGNRSIINKRARKGTENGKKTMMAQRKWFLFLTCTSLFLIGTITALMKATWRTPLPYMREGLVWAWSSLTALEQTHADNSCQRWYMPQPAYSILFPLKNGLMKSNSNEIHEIQTSNSEFDSICYRVCSRRIWISAYRNTELYLNESSILPPCAVSCPHLAQ